MRFGEAQHTRDVWVHSKNHASFKQALGPGVRIALMGAASQTVRVTDTPNWHLRRGRSANEVLIDGIRMAPNPPFC